MAEALKLPVIDLSASDRISSANSIRQACIECGFFYLVNHGVEQELLAQVFLESRNFFSLPLEDKSKLARKHNRGYSELYAENLDPDSSSTGDPKESYHIGSFEDVTQSKLNQWPSEDILPSWRPTMESYHRKVLSAGKRLISLIALALNLDEDFFEKVGAMSKPIGTLRLLHYPVCQLGSSDQEICCASAHSDYGMVTLLASNGVPGLQVCREKSKQPRVWEDVLHMDGSINVHCPAISTNMIKWIWVLLIMVAFFLDPNEDFVVECLASCCNESSPPRFPPIRSRDYLNERFRLTYGSSD
ncbi:hypothetical protein M0R45_024792 [Rubus argutus]|uniref:Non-haem dioxygenase N-terminal domain-containing protein n=1 Tax=Rubus argutus TaxID=59490 RepID=A0AAW1WST0_RUBAR